MTPASPRPVIQFVSPAPLTAALHIAVQRDMMNVSAFIRQALCEKLRSLGIDPATYEKGK